MQLAGSTALVSGANRGLGRHLAEQLLGRGATVYAGARRPESVDLPGVTPLQLDITDPDSVAAAADAVPDLTVLINNAGSFTGAGVRDGDLSDLRAEMEVHYIGTLQVTRAFAPALARAERSAVLNVLTALSWYSTPELAGYAAAKTAQWSVTNALRIWLAEQRTRVTALHVGIMDTDMVRAFDVPKADPAEVARIALDGVEAGRAEVLADDMARTVRSRLSGGVGSVYPELG